MAAPLRLGLVGAGRWGRNYVRTIAALPGVRLAGIASRNPETERLAPAGCSIVQDWRALLDRRSFDGLIVATPPSVHAEIALAAIDAGLPVLLEKPLALDPDRARAVKQKARERRAIVMVDHTHLFQPAYRALKALLPACGDVQAIRAEAGNLGPFRTDIPVLWDWGPHDVAMCIDLLGAPPVRAAARILEQRETQGGRGETVRADLEFGRRVAATIVLSNLLPSKTRRLSVRCERATLVYDDVATDKLVVQEGERRRPIAVASELPLTVAVREFAAAIAAGSFGGTDLDTGVAVVETLAACAATLTGRPGGGR